MAYKETLDAKIRYKTFIIVATTACLANLLGFVANTYLFGMSLPSIGCGICEIALLILFIFGIYTRHTGYSAALMLFLVSWVEAPLLYYVYGTATIVYFVLGIVGIALICPQRMRIPFFSITFFFDIVVIFISQKFPYHSQNVSEESLFYATLCSFANVGLTAFFMIRALLLQYEKQNQKILDMSEELRHAANQDPLTKLYNRRYLSEFLEMKMSHNENFITILLDLDNFKDLNDTYGHVYGDQVLITFGSILLREVKKIGIGARYGGEEFMIVLEDSTREEINELLKRMKESIGQFGRDTKNIEITFSGGVVEYHREDKVTQLFNRVDEKLYQAKNAGKDTIVF